MTETAAWGKAAIHIAFDAVWAAMICCGLAYAYNTRARDKRNLQRILGANRFEEPSLPDVQGWVSQAAKESHRYTFSASQRINVVFKGNRVTLFYGEFGFHAQNGGWVVRVALFALATPDQSHWMRQNKKAFALDYAGEKHCIYAVNMANLIEDLDR
ncbi:MAG TPA: hypothetical protein VG733_01045 [Chthoniobacteraceae bacterium]|nr:hypothetical protein [Chthoniobacteraceae bacterium]